MRAASAPGHGCSSLNIFSCFCSSIPSQPSPFHFFTPRRSQPSILQNRLSQIRKNITEEGKKNEIEANVWCCVRFRSIRSSRTHSTSIAAHSFASHIRHWCQQQRYSMPTLIEWPIAISIFFPSSLSPSLSQLSPECTLSSSARPLTRRTHFKCFV